MDRLNTAGVEVRRPRDRRPAWQYAALGLLVLALLGAFVQAVRIHQQDGQWSFVPSVAPERLTVDGRDYRRGDLDTEVYPNWVKRGTTSGGGTIYVLADTRGTPTVLWVKKGTKVWGYDLIGGP